MVVTGMSWIWFGVATIVGAIVGVIAGGVRVAVAGLEVQVNVPKLKVRPASKVMEAGKETILIDVKSWCAPPTWRATVDEISAIVRPGVCPDR
jgi:hypothetical protein